uniref:Odorant receptor n=1 Tax=Colaphellus bowringi TaxID=561076 RepID=A0A0S3J2R6_9CUCU|nr:odorant receptor OR27 [Colaphellus bowringi]
MIPSEDNSLSSMWLTKLILKSIFMWPDDYSDTKRKTFYKISMTICLFIQSGLVLNLTQNYHDWEKNLAVVSSMSTIFQTVFKMTALYQNSDHIKFVLMCMCRKFWPHNLDNENSEYIFKQSHSRRMRLMVFLLASGFLFSLGSVISPMFTRDTPFKSDYPFNWRRSPFYELIYLIQVAANGYLINMTVIGFDFLFMDICAALTNQYVLLGSCFERLGTENMQDFYARIRERGCQKWPPKVGGARRFLGICVQHHQLLTQITKVVGHIFNVVAFLQLCSSVVAICVSGFIATKDDVTTSQIATMGSYLIGHLIQLYIYCSVGNELLFQSSTLTNHIFGSNWYNLDSTTTKKDIIFIMKKAQIPAKLNAFKVFPLNFATFIAVVRLSFSSYTLLTSITNK